jgi:prepilin-type N-terminal cleavage/methylation domain-containing protein
MSAVRQAGFTLSELLVVLTVATMVMAFAAIAAVPRLANETMRSTLHNGGTLVRAARIEAIQRDRACRFVVDLTARTMSVVDTHGTATTTDDTLLRSAGLPSIVSVARPDAGSPITFTASGSVYHVEFDADGHVASGSGEMVLCSGERYGKLVVYTAGGVRYEKWDGTAWTDGS